MTNYFERARAKRPSVLLLSSVAVTGLSPMAQAQDVTATREIASEHSGLSEIIVTANRRAERSQDVPIMITALSPQRMEQQGIAKEQDLQASVPGLVVGPNGNGSREAQSFTIRGQGATFQASPGVVVYQNEVPLASAVTISQQGGPGAFVDLENLQVLSGPQGTLFGRNTTGGAVLLTAKKPTNEFGGWFKAETGNYKRAYMEGAVNIPVIDDKLLVRAVAAYHSRRGFTEDVVWNKYRDNENWYSGRLGVTLRPFEGVENYTMAYIGDSDTNGAGLVHRGFNIDGLKAVGFCSDGAPVPNLGVPCDLYREITNNAEDMGPRKTAFSTDVYQKTKHWGVNNSTEIELSETLTLRNIFSWQRLRIGYRYDGDATPLQQHDVDAGRLPPAGVVTLPVWNIPVTYNNNTGGTERYRDDQEQFTEELQLQGQSFNNALDWTVGGFYFRHKPVGLQGSRAVIYCPALYTGNCEASFNRYGNATKSKALYAQATLDFGAITPSLEGLRLTGGYRYTWDHVTGFARQFSRVSSIPGDVGFGQAKCSKDGSIVDFDRADELCNFSGDLKTKSPTWTVGVDYKVDPNVMLFAKVSRGYKAGGFNSYSVRSSTQTFLPEYLTSYEAGVKSDFYLGQIPFRFNMAAYSLDYTDIQRAVADYNPENGASGSRIFNADARIRGLEIEASARPVQGLTLSGNFGLTDGKYKDYNYTTVTGGLGCNGVVAPGGVIDMSCIDMQYTAKYIWSANAAYDLPLADNNGTLSFFLSYSHTSKQNTEAANLPTVQPGSILQPFGLMNASIDWRNVGGSNLDMGVFATNLTNKLYRISNTNVYDQASLLYWSNMYGEPRMYGLRATIRFGGEKH